MISRLSLLFVVLATVVFANQIGAVKTNGAGDINEKEFMTWLSSFTGVSEAEKNLTFGMMEKDGARARDFFIKSCRGGDERGCFQLAMKEISTGSMSGIDRLSKLAENGKNKKVAKQSARFLGAYVLDFMPNNQNATRKALGGVLPHALSGDSEMQLVAANLFATRNMYKDADSMLTKACTNPNIDDKVARYCRSSQNVEAIDEDGKVIGKPKCETGCQK
jgi:hypothetical protein